MLLDHAPMLLNGLEICNEAMKQERVDLDVKRPVEPNKAITKSGVKVKLPGLPAGQPCYHA